MAFAGRMLRALPDAGIPERLDFLAHEAIGRPLNADERISLTRFAAQQVAAFMNDDAAAAGVTKNVRPPVVTDIPATQLAAWTQVARVILNLHETITRE